MLLEDAFSSVLKRIREEKDVSQELLALKSGLDRTYISLLERGLRLPSLRTVFQLSYALGIEPEILTEMVKAACIKYNVDMKNFPIKEHIPEE